VSNSINLAIKASQLRQGIPLSDPEQVILQTKVVKEVEMPKDEDE